MCGIAGLVLRAPGPAWVDYLAGFAQVLAHRGPDDVGFLMVGRRESIRSRDITSLGDFRVGLAHRRLSILDLSKTGWQPMESPDGRYHVVFNGEVYNYLELRRTLEAKGHTFRGASDTEVLLAAWAEWGPACLDRFVGMFAFALLDTQDEVLYLVRDFFGIKPPLLYPLSGGAGLRLRDPAPSRPPRSKPEGQPWEALPLPGLRAYRRWGRDPLC